MKVPTCITISGEATWMELLVSQNRAPQDVALLLWIHFNDLSSSCLACSHLFIEICNWDLKSKISWFYFCLLNFLLIHWDLSSASILILKSVLIIRFQLQSEMILLLHCAPQSWNSSSISKCKLFNCSLDWFGNVSTSCMHKR